jgi:putative protease
MVELLSPARDFPSLTAAVKNGADSVYLGLEGLNMRAHTRGFNLEELREATIFCHGKDVKIYLCTNTIMKDRDLSNLDKILPEISSIGIDAIIASDLGTLSKAKDYDLDVHMSVQANISNLDAVKVLEQLGVKRVILSREMSLSEIREMAEKTSMELEVFIHGAMCLAISGRCFLSSFLYQKSANCGECIQPCRREWTITSGEDSLTIGESGEGYSGHILSPQDLSMVRHIPELMESGVQCFKIEGRARPADYVATVTRVYRQAIDSYSDGKWKFRQEWIDELSKVYNRGFDTGFYFQKPKNTSEYNQATRRKVDIGRVINYYPKVKAAEVQLWDDLELDDEIIIQGNTTGSISQKAQSLQVNHKEVKCGKKGSNVGLKVLEKVRPGDVVYKVDLRDKQGKLDRD